MKRIVFLVLAIAGSSAVLGGGSAPRAGAKPDVTVARFVNGRAILTKHVADGVLEVTLKTSKAEIIPFKEGFRWGGEDSTAPVALITSIVVRNASEKLFIPLSAYSDLGDPRQVSLKPNASGFDLFISGGDAGVSYTAVLVVEKGWLVRRRVSHGEFSKNAWEETKYAYNTLDN